MRVQIKFFAYFRDVFGSAVKTLVLPSGSSLEVLLSAVCDTPERRAEIFDGQCPKAEIIVLVNGTPADSFEGLRTGIADGDVIAVFPFMAGG